MTDRNPVDLVRQRGGRRLIPRVINDAEIRRLLSQLAEPYRTMVLVAACLGLRASEIMGLQWGDFNWADLTVRSSYRICNVGAIAKGGEAVCRQWALQQVLNDPRQNQRALSVASAYAFAENRDRAMLYLNQAYVDHDPRLPWVRALPQYWFLRGDSGYNALLQKVGLPPTDK